MGWGLFKKENEVNDFWQGALAADNVSDLRGSIFGELCRLEGSSREPVLA